MAVNEWIRNSGAFDGVIDFDAAVRDPANQKLMLADCLTNPRRLSRSFAKGIGVNASDVDTNEEVF